MYLSKEQKLEELFKEGILFAFSNIVSVIYEDKCEAFIAKTLYIFWILTAEHLLNIECFSSVPFHFISFIRGTVYLSFLLFSHFWNIYTEDEWKIVLFYVISIKGSNDTTVFFKTNSSTCVSLWPVSFFIHSSWRTLLNTCAWWNNFIWQAPIWI